MVSLSGIVSGIDTRSIVDQIIAARSQPIIKLENRVKQETARKDAITSLRGTIANLLSKAQALTSASGLNARMALASTSATGNKAVVSVSVNSSAATGTFQVSVEKLATATTLASQGAIGTPVTQNVALSTAGFGVTVTTGTFTINGVSITIDASTVLSDGVNNGASNSILGKINNAGAGVTASIINDGSGNPNLLQLTSGASITLGSGGDTSNFLAAAHLLESPGATTRTSTQGLGQTQATVNLLSGRLATAFTQNSGTFRINGVDITYDAANESLTKVLDRINASGAGVTASYDPFTDRTTLTAKSTGSGAISLSNVTGNFLQVIRLVDGSNAIVGTQTLGQTAEYKINSGATRYSSSNTVTDALPGVTMTLLAAAPGDNATVTVSTNDGAITGAVQKFVEQYNSTMTLLAENTKVVPDGKSGELANDSNLRRLQQSLRGLITTAADNLTGPYTSLADLGLSFGAVGAAVDATRTLTLDAAKLNTAIQTNRDAVISLLSANTVTAAFTDGAGSLASASGAPDKLTAGTYTITDGGMGSLSMVFVPTDGSLGFSTTGVITAGGTNNTLIPGMTLVAGGVLTAGTDTITVTRNQIGAAVKIAELLDQQVRTAGSLDTRTDAIDSEIEDINARIARMEARLTTEQQRLERRFAAMEQAFARFQSQQGFLQALSTQLSQNSTRNRR